MIKPFYYWHLAMHLIKDSPDSNRIAVLYTRDANLDDVLYANPSETALVDGINTTYSPLFERALTDCSGMHDFQTPALHMEQRVAGVYLGDIALINLRRFQPESHSAISTMKSVMALKNQLQLLFPDHAPQLHGYVKCPAPTIIIVGT